jgi:hypothetical protein
VLAAILTGGVSSCANANISTSSGGGGTTTVGVTTAGTYTIPVTATANGVTHYITNPTTGLQQNLTLTVD